LLYQQQQIKLKRLQIEVQILQTTD
jgi:hypothetical protein